MNVKLALAAAAVVGLAGTAQAADLAKKAPAAANYVKICDAYGAGYFYIPGSETCLKIGGYVRAEVRTGNSGSYLTNPVGGIQGPLNQSQRDSHGIMTRARANINFDARTATEMGLLRSYIEMWMTNDSASTGTVGVNLRQAFVQFGGLTAGRAQSFFDFIEGGYNIGNIEQDSSDKRANLLGYTFAFGNGISASIAIEDQSTADSGLYYNSTAFAGTAATTGYAGVKYPDLVANVNITQAWGRAQLMAALHDNYTSLASAGVATDKWGFAVGAGVEVNLPMLGAGDKVFLQGVYSKGAVGYALVNKVAGYSYDFNVDVLAAPTTIKQTTAWSIDGGIKHNFSKAVEANFGASYAKVDQAGALAALDFSQYIVGGDLRWKPVSGLTLAAAVDYRQVNFSSAAKGAVAGLQNSGAWLGTIRVQRDF